MDQEEIKVLTQKVNNHHKEVNLLTKELNRLDTDVSVSLMSKINREFNTQEIKFSSETMIEDEVLKISPNLKNRIIKLTEDNSMLRHQLDHISNNENPDITKQIELSNIDRKLNQCYSDQSKLKKDISLKASLIKDTIEIDSKKKSKVNKENDNSNQKHDTLHKVTREKILDKFFAITATVFGLGTSVYTFLTIAEDNNLPITFLAIFLMISNGAAYYFIAVNYARGGFKQNYRDIIVGLWWASALLFGISFYQLYGVDQSISGNANTFLNQTSDEWFSSEFIQNLNYLSLIVFETLSLAKLFLVFAYKFFSPELNDHLETISKEIAQQEQTINVLSNNITTNREIYEKLNNYKDPYEKNIQHLEKDKDSIKAELEKMKSVKETQVTKEIDTLYILLKKSSLVLNSYNELKNDLKVKIENQRNLISILNTPHITKEEAA